MTTKPDTLTKVTFIAEEPSIFCLPKTTTVSRDGLIVEITHDRPIRDVKLYGEIEI